MFKEELEWIGHFQDADFFLQHGMCRHIEDKYRHNTLTPEIAQFQTHV